MTEPVLATPAQPAPRRKTLLLILALVVLLLVHALISLSHWLQLVPVNLELSLPITCNHLRICNLRYPPHFGFAVLILLPAMVALGLLLRQVALKMTQDVEVPLPAAKNYLEPWRRLFLLFTILAVTLTVFTIQDAHSSELKYPHPLLWFGTILLWGVAFYSLDRASQRPSIFTRSSTIGWLVYILLLVLLGYLYHVPILQSLEARVIFVIAVALSLHWFWRLGRVSGLVTIWALIAVVGMALYTYGLDSWRYAFIGDEYAFFNGVWSLLENPTTFHLLSSRGFSETHPTFSIVLQAITVLLYGGDIYSWRINGVLMVFLSAPSIFVLVRQLAGRNAGLSAVILFFSAHHLLAFSRIGYNQPLLLPFFCAMLALSVTALRHRSSLAMFLAGFSGAFTFYTFTLGIPLIVLPLFALFLWTICPQPGLTLKQRMITSLPLACACIVSITVTSLPRLTNTIWLSDGATHTLFYRTEVPNLTDPLLQQIIPNTVYTLTASLYFDNSSHYVSGPLIDPISSALMLVGIAGLIAIVSKRYIAIWLLLSFLAAVFAVGGLVPYGYPPHTRTFFLVIFYAIFGGLGAAFLWQRIRNQVSRWQPVTRYAAVAGLITLLVALNAYQFFYLYPHTILEDKTAMIVREFQSSPPEITFYYVSRFPHDHNAWMVLDLFGYNEYRLHFVTNPSPMEALAEIRRNASPPYRVLIGWDVFYLRLWQVAARLVWAEYPTRLIVDDSGWIHFSAIDVPN